MKDTKRPTIQATDRRISTLAREATKAAYHKTLASGHSVLIATDGEIRRISPDGKSFVVKKIEPNVPVKKGEVIRIK